MLSDVSQVIQEKDIDEVPLQSSEEPVCLPCDDQTWWNNQGWEGRNQSVDALGKGKAKGKGKGPPVCYNCFNAGHIARNCSTGSGKDQWLGGPQRNPQNGGIQNEENDDVSAIGRTMTRN